MNNITDPYNLIGTKPDWHSISIGLYCAIASFAMPLVWSFIAVAANSRIVDLLGLFILLFVPLLWICAVHCAMRARCENCGQSLRNRHVRQCPGCGANFWPPRAISSHPPAR